MSKQNGQWISGGFIAALVVAVILHVPFFMVRLRPQPAPGKSPGRIIFANQAEALLPASGPRLPLLPGAKDPMLAGRGWNFDRGLAPAVVYESSLPEVPPLRLELQETPLFEPGKIFLPPIDEPETARLPPKLARLKLKPRIQGPETAPDLLEVPAWKAPVAPEWAGRRLDLQLGINREGWVETMILPTRANGGMPPGLEEWLLSHRWEKVAADTLRWVNVSVDFREVGDD